MATSKKVSGKVLPYLQISNINTGTIGVSAVNLGDDAKSISLGEGNGPEAETFYEASVGFAPMAFEVEMVWSPVKNSAYHALWAAAGQQNVPFVYGRLGNTTAAADKPVLAGFVNIPARTGFEATAGEDSDSFTVTLEIVGTPTWTHA